jgi:catechol 2,3-dioxygenase-like lactoylglutathione lyase family enzyme
MNLNQVTIPSKNVKIAVDFYQKLGLNLIVENFPSYARFVCPDGNTTFSIHLVDKLTEGNGTVVYFECDNLDETIEKLKSQGFLFDSEPVDQPWLWREAHLKDLDGNIICLYYAGNNRLNPPWRLP